MAVYRQIQISFWQDDFVLNLTPEEKYFYIYLMTNSKTTQCGIYELPKKVIEFETGYNRETVDKLIDRFIEYGKILYSEETREIMLVNWIKHNANSSIKVVTRIKKELANVKNDTLLKKFNEVCIRYGYPMYTDPQKEKEKTKEETETETQEEEKTKKPLKQKFAEFVLMTEEEHAKLVAEHGEEKVQEMIRVLDNYKGANGKKYKSDYKAILSWVVDEVKKREIKSRGSPTDKLKQLEAL